MSEDLLLTLADAIKRATGASLNQTDVTAELERIKAAYAPPVQTPVPVPRGMFGVPGIGRGVIPYGAEEALACK